MMGLEQTELIAERWQQANSSNITLVSASLFWNGSKISMIMLKMLRGAQDMKKMTLTVMSILLVFFLLSIWQALLCEERFWLACNPRERQTLQDQRVI